MTSSLKTAAAGLALLAVGGAAQAQAPYGHDAASPAGQSFAIVRDGVSCTLSFKAPNGPPPVGTAYSGEAEMACDGVRLSFDWSQGYGGHEFSLDLNAYAQSALHLVDDGCEGVWPEFEIGEVRDSVCWFDAEGLSAPPRIERTQ